MNVQDLSVCDVVTVPGGRRGVVRSIMPDVGRVLLDYNLGTTGERRLQVVHVGRLTRRCSMRDFLLAEMALRLPKFALRCRDGLLLEKTVGGAGGAVSVRASAIGTILVAATPRGGVPACWEFSSVDEAAAVATRELARLAVEKVNT